MSELTKLTYEYLWMILMEAYGYLIKLSNYGSFGISVQIS